MPAQSPGSFGGSSRTRLRPASKDSTAHAGVVGMEAAPRPLPRQVRKSRLLVGVLVILSGAALTAYLFVSASGRSPAVVVVRDVPLGAQVTRADLGTTLVAVDAQVETVPGGQLSQAVGQIAADNLRRGTLLARSQLTSARSPVAGQQVVPVPLKASQLPADGLRPGDQVLAIATPGAGGEETAAPNEPLDRDIPATVDRVGQPTEDGMTVVNLLVTADVGPRIAKQAAQGRVAIVVTSRRP